MEFCFQTNDRNTHLIENYKNKNIPQQYIDVIVEKMKASINEFVSNK